MRVMKTALIRYDAMCRAIDEAHKVDEVKEIRDQAIAMQQYARQALNTDAERHAAEIRLRAERKAGQLLTKMKTNGELRRGGNGSNQFAQRSREDTFALESIGVSKQKSSQWQKLGAMTQRDFNLAVGESVQPPTTKGILRAATEPQQRKQTVAPEALWLWGRLLDFERDGLLGKAPADVMETMVDPMKDDVHRLAPKVATWLKRIGAVQ